MHFGKELVFNIVLRPSSVASARTRGTTRTAASGQSLPRTTPSGATSRYFFNYVYIKEIFLRFFQDNENFQEMYDLNKDPYQMNNLAMKPEGIFNYLLSVFRS